MSVNDSAVDPFGEVADKFMEEYRQGKDPNIEDYAKRYPECAGQIHELLPMLMVMEKVNQMEQSASGGAPVGIPGESMVGREIGDYRIIREIGRGGMGIVYEAEQISLGRHVALKLLPGRARVDSKQVTRFEREAKAAARLHHTNIVPVFGVGEDDGLSYYVMQFINGLGLDGILDELKRIDRLEQRSQGATGHADEEPGYPSPSSIVQRFSSPSESLEPETGRLSGGLAPEETRDLTFDLLKEPTTSRTGSSSAVQRRSDTSSVATFSTASEYWRNVARIGIQVAEALQYAHEQGVIHRDIKPSNLLLDVHNIVWVTDFGLAKSDDSKSLTLAGDILGTIRYMPPEAFNGEYDGRSDVYSLGITLYELITLKPAFSSSDRRELIKLVTHTRPTRLRRLRPNAPPDLATIIEKTIEPDRVDRYQTAQKLADDLRRFLADEPILAKRTPYLERLRRWSRRNKGLAASFAGIACLLVVIAVGGISAAVYFRQQREETTLLAERNQRLLENNRVSLREAVQAADRLEVARMDAVSQREETQRNLYYSHMGNALQAIAGHRGMGRALSMLHRWRPTNPGQADLRDWEWYYINGACHQEAVKLGGHDLKVHGIALSDDDRYLASIGLDDRVLVWDLVERKIIHTIEGVPTGHSVDFSPDGSLLAAGTQRGATIWNTRTWDIVHQAHKTRPVFAVRWSPDGVSLAYAVKEDPLRAADRRPAEIMLTKTSGWSSQRVATVPHLGFYTTSLSFSPDGRFLAYPAGYRAGVWDLEQGKQHVEFHHHRGSVQAIAFHPRRAGVVVTGARDSRALVWDIHSGEVLSELKGHTHAISSVAWHPEDATRLATASWDGTIRVWNTEQQRTVHSYQSHAMHAFTAVWNRSGSELASCGDDGLVKLWSAEGPSNRFDLEASQQNIVGLDISPNGKLIATGDGRSRVCVIDTDSRRVLWNERHGASTVRDVLFTPDGDQLISVARGGGIYRWRIDDPNERVRRDSLMNSVRTAHLSQDGKWLALGGGKGVEIWYADFSADKPIRVLPTSFGLVKRVRWNPDSRRLAIIGDSGSIEVHDMEKDRTKSVQTDVREFSTIGWSNDGTRLATASFDHHIRIWDAETMKRLNQFEGHFDLIVAVSWSPNDRRIFSVDARGTAKLWDPEVGQETITLRTTIGEVRGSCWSSNGLKLAAAADGSITVWDATKGHEAEQAFLSSSSE